MQTFYRVIYRVTLIFLLATGLSQPAVAMVVSVSTPAALIDAINNASPGDVITLAAGTYDIGQNINCATPGSAAQPIVVRAETLGQALIRFDAVEGFKVSARYWVFENLDISGVCANDSDCEHAFHVFGDADFTTIRHSRLHEYNAMIKGNGAGNPYLFPDDVVIEFNEFFNSSVRNTGNPVTFIDVVGGRRWQIRANYIADFGKGGGNQISYGAFLKGNSKDGVFERNLVICELNHTEGTRLGLSFGGGGTSPDSICEEMTCTPEHENGIMRNNLIVNCPDDVGIYLNEALNVQIHHNTLYNNTGIDVRFASSVADLRNNILSGSIRNRDGGTHTKGSNLEMVTLQSFSNWFNDPEGADFSLLDGSQLVDQGENVASVSDDYCGNPRNDGNPDIGAVEYINNNPCDTTQPGSSSGDAIFEDQFE